MAEQNPQEIPYKVTIDESDVQRAINAVETAAARAASSISGLSANVTGAIANQAANLGHGPAGSGGGNALMPGLTAHMLAGPAAPYDPRATLARDAMMQQYLAMGASPGGMGAGLTTPFGDPTINVFRQPQAAPAFQVPLGFLSSYAPPGAPGDPRRDRMVFGQGEGSMVDLGWMVGGRLTTGRIANDNLEDRMFRNIDRRAQFFGQNLQDVETFMASDVAGGFTGGAMGAFAGNFFGGPVGGLAGGIVGGVVGQGLGNLTAATLGRISKPYEEMAQDFRTLTSPFIRGEKLGGGISNRETFQVQRELAQKLSEDNFFNQQEFQEIVNVAGETGAFRFTGSKDQALDAITKMGESVKTLYALGVKSKEMLSEIDKSLGAFGINPGQSPGQTANFFQAMAVSAQSAGISVSQMTTAAAPAGQLFASQGIGMAAGARIGALNQGIAGDLFRSQSLGAFENAYYGGTEGFGQKLTTGTAAMLRTPVGQSLIASMMAPGMDNLKRMMAGETMDIPDILSGVGSYASNPGKFLGMQMLMPKLTQQLGPEVLQMGMMNTQIQQFRNITGNQSGPLNPEEFIGIMARVNGLTEDEAMAQYDMLTNAGTAARGLRRSAQDQMGIARVEAMRSPGMERFFSKLYDRTIGQFGANVSADLGEFNANIARNINRFVTGTYDYELGGTGREALDNPMAIRSQSLEAADFLEELGFTSKPKRRSSEEMQTSHTEQTVADALGSPLVEVHFTEMALAAGENKGQIASYVDQIRGAGTVTKRLDSRTSSELQMLAEEATGLSGIEAIAKAKTDTKANVNFDRVARGKGFDVGDINAFLGLGFVQVGVDDVPPTLGGPSVNLANVPRPQRERTTEEKTRGRVLDDLRGRSGLADQRTRDMVKRMVDAGEITEADGRGFLDPNAQSTSRVPSRINKTIDTETQNRLTNLAYDEVVKSLEEFQVENMDAISGMRSYAEGRDSSVSQMADNAAATILGTRGRDELSSYVVTQGKGAELKTLENFAPAFFGGKPYAELSAHEQAQLGANVASLAGNDIGANTGGLRALVAGAPKAVKSVGMLNLEKLEQDRVDILNSLGGSSALTGSDVRRALEVTGKERFINAEVVSEMSIQQMATESADGVDFSRRLTAAGITDKVAQELGIDVNAFVKDRAGFIEERMARVNAAMSKTSEGNRGKLLKAQAEIQKTGFAGMGDADEAKIFQATTKYQGYLFDLEKVAGSSIDTQTRERIKQRLKGDSIGGEKLGDLLSHFNEARGDRSDGITSLTEALLKDPTAMGDLGVSKGFLEAVSGATANLESGESISVDQAAAIFKQTMPELKPDQLKRQSEKEAKYLDGLSPEDRKRQGMEFLRGGVTQAVTNGSTADSRTGENLAGGILSPESLQGITRAIEQQNEVAKSLEKIASQFEGGSVNDMVAQIGELKKSVGQNGTFPQAVDKFAETIDKLTRTPLRATVETVRGASGGGAGRPPAGAERPPGSK